MSATSTSPARNRPGATASPTFSAWNVTVTSASTAGPATSPVEASTPDGTSSERTGAPRELISSMWRAASARGAPRKPVPKSASTTTSALLPVSANLIPSSLTRARFSAASPVHLLLGPRENDLDRAPGLVEDPGDDEPVASVRARPAPDGKALRVGEPPQRRRSGGSSRPLHQLERRALEGLLGRPHLGGRVERLSPHRRRRRSLQQGPSSGSWRGRSRPLARVRPSPSSSPRDGPRAWAGPRSRSPAT